MALPQKTAFPRGLVYQSHNVHERPYQARKRHDGLDCFARLLHPFWRDCWACRFRAALLLLIDNLVTILVVAFGLMMVWQGYRLPIENARRIIAQLGDADDARDLRKRTMFATNKMFGIVLHDDSTFTFTWDKFNGWNANDECITLSLRGQAVLIALDANGFVKGDKQGFLELLEKKIVPKKDNAFVAWTKRVCFKLDNWKDVKAKALKEEAKKKEAKQAAKEAKKEAKAAKKK